MMRVKKMLFAIPRKFQVLLGLLFCINVAFLLLLGSNFVKASETQTILLTEKGFSPEKITISKGTMVTFTTNRNLPFWPASNLHPAHSIYPAFDPKKEIAPPDSWSFTFDEEGTYRFHDHLNPSFQGEITVSNGKKHASATTVTLADCQKLTAGGRSQCYENLIYQTLEESLSEAFSVIGTVYATDPSFTNDCHGLTHTLGKKAYEIYEKKGDITLTEKATYCGYGFYHGFMETLLHDTKDVTKARKFCDYVQESLKKESADAGGSCIHGIGHGSVPDVPEQYHWGKPQVLVDKGINLCETISENKDVLFRCLTGVYNAYEILATQNQYLFTHTPNDPFAFCKKQTKPEYREACYPQLTVAALQMAENDWGKAAAFVETIPTEKDAQQSMIAVIVERSRQNEKDYSTPLSFCRGLSERLYLSCLTGYAEGFLKYGPPENEYKNALAFCGFGGLTEDERTRCFTHVLPLIRIWYTKEKSRTICLSVPAKYQYNNCTYQ